MPTDDAKRFRLASHVFACSTRSYVVCLDLKLDEYFGFDAVDANELAKSIIDWPSQDASVSPSLIPYFAAEPPASGPSRRGSAELIEGMLKKGLVVEVGDRSARAAQPTRMGADLPVEQPRKALIEGYSDIPTIIRPRDAAWVIAASVKAKGLLRWRSLEDIATRVHSRACKHGASRQRNSNVDMDEVRGWVAAFRRVRPLIYAARDACLLDSLALSEFLAGYGLFPRWIFGVTAQPFRAHCWLQQGSIVINDTPDHVRWFTAIMAL